jgi:hypothetical protein
MRRPVMLMASVVVLCFGLTTACEKKPGPEVATRSGAETTVPKLHLFISQKDGKTQTSYGIDGITGEVVFYNLDEEESLVVTVVSEPADAGPALCAGDTTVDEFSVDHARRGDRDYLRPGKTSLTVCPKFTGKSFKYTAQIGKSAAEDPRVKLERPLRSGDPQPQPPPAVLPEPIIIIEGDPQQNINPIIIIEDDPTGTQ